MSHYDERRHPVLKILLDRLEARAVAINCLGRRKGQSDARLAELRHEKELDQERINTLHARVGKLHDKLGWRNQPEEDPTEVGPEVLGEPLVVSGWAPGTAPEGCTEAKSADTCVADARMERDAVVKERNEAWGRLVEIGNAVQLERGKEDVVEKVAGLASRLDDALERGIAVAKQHADLRLAAGCAEGQELEDRVRELAARGTPAEEARLRGLVANLRDERVALTHYRDLEKERDEAVSQRDDALERHKQAHDRAMALHVVIDHAVEELRKVHSDRKPSENRVSAHNAIAILVNDERVTEAAAEVKALRAQCAEVHPAEDMRRWRKAAGCREGQTLLERIEVLTANADNWEAEALERTQNQTDLENRMDEAAKIINEQPVLTQRDRQALAILVRGEGADVTQAEAWEKTARALNDRINQAVKVLENVEEPSVPEMEALSLLTSDCAGGEA